MWTLAFTCVLLSLASFVESQCPSGWVNHGDSCYHFSHDKENWIDAQVVCEHFDGYLAEIHTQFEDNFLMQEAVRNKLVYWIGASDMMVENEWRWLHSNTQLDYTNWAASEPNNLHGNENCVEMRGTSSDWNDHTCGIAQNYICQKDRDEGTEVIG